MIKMLIVFEGLDNCGKTTQAQIIYKILKKKRYNVYLSKELTTEIGKITYENIKKESTKARRRCENKR